MGSLQGPKSKRMLRRDFGKANNVWRQDAGEQKRPRREEGGKDSYLSREELGSPEFEEYYQAQGIVPEGEWTQFMATLKTNLPITFRVNGYGRFAAELRDKLENDFFASFQQGPITVSDEPGRRPRYHWWKGQPAAACLVGCALSR